MDKKYRSANQTSCWGALNRSDMLSLFPFVKDYKLIMYVMFIDQRVLRLSVYERRIWWAFKTFDGGH